LPFDEAKNVAELVAEVSKGFGTTCNPVQYLAELMIGFDPRKRSGKLFKIIKACADEGRQPNDHEWQEIKDLVLYTDLYRLAPVTLDQSTEAAKKLIEFIHAKKRATTITEGESTLEALVAPLTEEEVDDFEQWLIERF